MLANLGAGPKMKGRKDLRGRKLLLVDDEANPYRTMCFTIAAKIVKKRGGDVEIRAPKTGEIPHAEMLGGAPAKPEPRTRTQEPRARTSTSGTQRPRRM